MHASLVLLVPLLAAVVRTSPPPHPVILIPGDGGAQLQAKLTGKPKVVHYWCAKKTDDFFALWLNLELFLPAVIGCWVDNMKLVYNTTSNRTSDMPGVIVRVPGFGNTSTMEWLDTSKASEGRYFTDIVEAMLTLGYSRGKSIVGAPYDWRRAPNEFQTYYADLKKLIEDTYRYNGNRRVLIVAHSMGNPVMLYFYNSVVSQAWKDKFLYAHISVAGAWGGAMQIVRLFASGEHVMAKVNNKNYTLKNVDEFFKDINYEVGISQYQNTAHLLDDLHAPNVEVHCIYGYGIDTPETFEWSKSWFPDYQPSTNYGDGDGTVNRRSLEACGKWIGKNDGKKVTLYALKEAEHMDILQRDDVIELIKRIAMTADG